MVAEGRVSLLDLPKGYSFEPMAFRLTQADVAAYLDAVGDRNEIYERAGLAPPLAVAARALGALMEKMELPAGTLHTSQEVAMKAGAPVDSLLRLAGRVAQRTERGGAVICVIEFEIRASDSTEHVMTGRTTVAVAA
jgi:hypothetical protein